MRVCCVRGVFSISISAYGASGHQVLYVYEFGVRACVLRVDRSLACRLGRRACVLGADRARACRLGRRACGLSADCA